MAQTCNPQKGTRGNQLTPAWPSRLPSNSNEIKDMKDYLWINPPGEVQYHTRKSFPIKKQLCLLELEDFSLNGTQIHVLVLELAFMIFPREQCQPSPFPQDPPSPLFLSRPNLPSFLFCLSCDMVARLLSISNCSSLNLLQVGTTQWPGQKRSSSCASVNIVLDGWLSLFWKPTSHSCYTETEPLIHTHIYIPTPAHA